MSILFGTLRTTYNTKVATFSNDFSSRKGHFYGPRLLTYFKLQSQPIIVTKYNQLGRFVLI